MVDVGVVVLTGGTGRRLGGVDKAALVVGDRTLLDRVLEVARAVGPVVVVGEPVAGTTCVREDPPGGGPAAGLLAGAAALATPTVVALAVDQPWVTPGTVDRLLVAASGRDGSVLVDEGGREQYLCAAYDREALLAAAPPDPHGMPLRRLVAGLDLAGVPARGREAHDVDTPDDLAAARACATRAPVTTLGGVNLHDWIDELCDELDVEVDLDEALVLDLARDAAHAVERRAAPITTFLLGYAAAASDGDPGEVERLAGLAAALAARWDKTPSDLAREDDEVEVAVDEGVEPDDA